MATIVHKKRASEPEGPFEQAFANLAYGYLREKAPRLLEYLVGFQLLDRDEDDTKAAGIFGFKVGEKWLIAPVFFLNGDLKGHELLYLKKEDQFLPFDEGWANMILSRRFDALGEASSETRESIGVNTPNLYGFSRPLVGQKYGSLRVQPWAQDHMPTIAKLRSSKTAADAVQRFAKSTDTALKTLLKTSAQSLMTLEHWYRNNPAIKEAIDKFHGGNRLFVECGEALYRDAQKQAADAGLLRPAYSTKPTTETDLLGNPLPKQAEPLVRVVVKEEVIYNGSFGRMSEEEQQKLLGDGFSVSDNRTADQTSVAYDPAASVRLSSPTETGIYDVLVHPGEFKKCLCVMNPVGSDSHSCLVVELGDGDKDWALARTRDVLVDQQSSSVKDLSGESYEKWFEDLPSAQDAKADVWYVALNEKGSGTCPWFAVKETGDNLFTAEFDCNCTSGRDDPADAYPAPGAMIEGRRSPRPENIYFNDRKGTALRIVGRDLQIPADVKLFKLRSSGYVRKPNGDVDWDKSKPYHSYESALRLGDLPDLHAEIVRKSACLKVWSDGNSFCIAEGDEPKTFDKVAAAKHLLLNVNLNEEQTKEILRKAAKDQRKPTEYRVEKAAIGIRERSFSSPIPEEDFGSEETFGGSSYRTSMPQEMLIPVNGMESTTNDLTGYMREFQPDSNAVHTAQRASQEGVKEVLDASILTSLLKVVRKDNMIDRFLPSLMDAMDSLGRLLFLFYWHGEEFEDQYGKQDMPELEDILRNAFEDIGKVALFLRRKTVQPFGPAGNSLGEPSIEEVARN